MSLSKSITFKVVGYLLATVALLSFALRVLFKVKTGHGNDVYVSGKGVVWTYNSALVVISMLGLVLLFVGAHRLWLRYRDRN